MENSYTIRFSIRVLTLLSFFPLDPAFQPPPPSFPSGFPPAATTAAHGSTVISQPSRCRSRSSSTQHQLPTLQFRPRLRLTPTWIPPPTSLQNSPPSSAVSDTALLGARKCAIPVTLRRRRCRLPSALSPRPFPLPPLLVSCRRGALRVLQFSWGRVCALAPEVGLHFPGSFEA